MSLPRVVYRETAPNWIYAQRLPCRCCEISVSRDASQSRRLCSSSLRTQRTATWPLPLVGVEVLVVRLAVFGLLIAHEWDFSLIFKGISECATGSADFYLRFRTCMASSLCVTFLLYQPPMNDADSCSPCWANDSTTLTLFRPRHRSGLACERACQVICVLGVQFPDRAGTDRKVTVAMMNIVQTWRLRLLQRRRSSERTRGPTRFVV